MVQLLIHERALVAFLLIDQGRPTLYNRAWPMPQQSRTNLSLSPLAHTSTIMTLL